MEITKIIQFMSPYNAFFPPFLFLVTQMSLLAASCNKWHLWSFHWLNTFLGKRAFPANTVIMVL